MTKVGSKEGKEDTSRTFARYIASAQFKDLPSKVVELAKLDILDTLGVTVAGSSFDESTKPLLELAREWGGTKESTILVFGDKVPADNSVLVNGSMAEAFDFTDAYGRGLTHVGQATVIPAFAIAEREGKVNGGDLINAVVLGQEISLRMYYNMRVEHGFAVTGVLTCFGAATTVGKLLRLDEEQMTNALGIAFNQIAGSFQSYIDCVTTKELIGGLTSRTGITSGLLARKGFTGTRNTLEGKNGFCAMYCGGNCNLEKLTANLGKEFEVMHLGFKPYPCGY